MKLDWNRAAPSSLIVVLRRGKADGRQSQEAMWVEQPQTNDSLVACDQQGRMEVGSSLGPRGNVVLAFIAMGPLLSVTV